jgi:hypothetical protein
MRGEPAIRIDLVRGKRENDPLDFSIRQAFEGGEEEPRVEHRALDVAVGRNDEDGPGARG